MSIGKQKDSGFPVSQVRRFLEPGPITLITSAHQDRHNIMTHGWHTILEFSPSLVGCMISAANHSFELICESGGCVINLPTADMIDTVVGIGNCSGSDTDKFKKFGLTAAPSDIVEAPLIKECHANFECEIYDADMIEAYHFFIFEVVRAHVAPAPEHPETLHYKGDGRFMTAGGVLDKSHLFRPEMLG